MDDLIISVFYEIDNFCKEFIPYMEQQCIQNQLVSYEKEAGGKTRRYYRITKEGRKELLRRKEEWQVYSGAVAQVMSAWIGGCEKGGELYGV